MLNLQSNTQDFKKDYTNISYFENGCIIGQVAKEVEKVVTFKLVKRKKQEKGKNEKEQVDTTEDAFSLADEISNFNFSSLHLE